MIRIYTLLILLGFTLACDPSPDELSSGDPFLVDGVEQITPVAGQNPEGGAEGGLEPEGGTTEGCFSIYRFSDSSHLPIFMQFFGRFRSVSLMNTRSQRFLLL